MRKLGLNLGGIKDLPVADYLKLIVDAGFDCFFSGLRQELEDGTLPELAAKYGIEYETVHAPFKNINEMWLYGEAGEAMLAELMHTVDVCHEMGISKAVIHLSAGENAPTPCDIGFERFDRLVGHASKKEVILAMENQRKIGNLGVLLEKYNDNPYVGFCYDIGHEYCFTPGREYMNMFGSMLVCTHIHDNFAIYNKDQHMIPFDGKIDYVKFAEQLNKYGYKGPLTLEILRSKTKYYDDMTPEQYVNTAFERAVRLRNIVDAE